MGRETTHDTYVTLLAPSISPTYLFDAITPGQAEPGPGGQRRPCHGRLLGGRGGSSIADRFAGLCRNPKIIKFAPGNERQDQRPPLPLCNTTRQECAVWLEIGMLPAGWLVDSCSSERSGARAIDRGRRRLTAGLGRAGANRGVDGGVGSVRQRFAILLLPVELFSGTKRYFSSRDAARFCWQPLHGVYLQATFSTRGFPLDICICFYRLAFSLDPPFAEKRPTV